MLLRKLLNVICRKNRLCMWSRLFFYSAEEWKGDNMELSKQLYREIEELQVKELFRAYNPDHM